LREKKSCWLLVEERERRFFAFNQQLATSNFFPYSPPMSPANALLLILCGVLAAANFIIQKQPNSRKFIDKVSPYQGWIGVVACVVGIWIVVTTLLYGPGIYSTLGRLITGCLEASLGFLMGFGLIVAHVLKDSPDAVAKAQQMRDKLATMQIPLGLAAIVLGVVGLLSGR
jgi:hypothetical protein